MSAIALNGLSRWSVPAFIMITGALMLADPRSFSVGYYLRHRVTKVLIPFVAWSFLYAVLAGLTQEGYDATATVTRLAELPTHESYYHLGFFYYFIPLYLLIPALVMLVNSTRAGIVVALTAAWFTLTALYLLDADGVLGTDLIMYGGYLLFGYVLFTYRPLPVPLLALLALGAVVITNSTVIGESLNAGSYEVGRWFSYKTANTAIVAAFVFAAALAYASRLSANALGTFRFIAEHSLGVFLIHPLFLWPAHEFELYRGHPLVVIATWTFVCGGLALLTSWLLRRHRFSAWLVP